MSSQLIPDIEDIAQYLPYNLGCAIKYIWKSSGRKDNKTTIEDLRTAIDYLQYEIEKVIDLEETPST
jgi:hypothetical protein